MTPEDRGQVPQWGPEAEPWWGLGAKPKKLKTYTLLANKTIAIMC